MYYLIPSAGDNRRLYTVEYGADTVRVDAEAAFESMDELRAYLNRKHPSDIPGLTRVVVSDHSVSIFTEPVYPPLPYGDVERTAWLHGAIDQLSRRPRLTFSNKSNAYFFVVQHTDYVQLTRDRRVVYRNPRLIAARKARAAAIDRQKFINGDYDMDLVTAFTYAYSSYISLPDYIKFDEPRRYPKRKGWGRYSDSYTVSDVISDNILFFTRVDHWLTKNAPRWYASELQRIYHNLIDEASKLLPYARHYRRQSGRTAEFSRAILRFHRRLLACRRKQQRALAAPPDTTPQETTLQDTTTQETTV